MSATKPKTANGKRKAGAPEEAPPTCPARVFNCEALRTGEDQRVQLAAVERKVDAGFAELRREMEDGFASMAERIAAKGSELGLRLQTHEEREEQLAAELAHADHIADRLALRMSETLKVIARQAAKDLLDERLGPRE